MQSCAVCRICVSILLYTEVTYIYAAECVEIQLLN